MPSQLEKGRKVGQYEILEPLGKGGMASVYRAYQPSLDREVAIKVMAERYTSDPAFVERFRREARSIARLRHPNILTVFDAGEDSGLLYIVMELVEGSTLKELMSGKPLPLEKAENIITQIASALDYAHNSGIIHRDVKPSNVLMDNSGRAVLSDFGIVKMIGDQNNMQLTVTGTGVGTPDYMSPEQAMGESLDVRSDEYSLAIMFYEMMTGRPPFQGDTPIAIVMGHVSKPLPMPTKYNPNVPPSIEQVLLKGLAKKPEDRYNSCGEFARAVKEAVAQPYSGFPTLKFDSNLRSDVAVTPGSNNSEADQLYQEARRLEQQNNFNDAFAIYNRLNSQFFNYRDVPSMLERYRLMGYGQTNTPPWQRIVNNQTPSGGVISSPVINNISNPGVPYGSINKNSSGTGTEYSGKQPSINQGYSNNGDAVASAEPVAKKSRSNLPLVVGGLALVVGVAVIAVVILASSSKSTADQTPTAQAIIPATSIVASTPSPQITSAKATTSVAQSTTTLAITAAPSTVLATSTTQPTDTPDATTVNSVTDTPVVSTPTVYPATTAVAAKTAVPTYGPITYKTYKPASNKYSVEIPNGWYVSSTNDGVQDADVFAATATSTEQMGINNLQVPGADASTINDYMNTVLSSAGFNVTKTEDYTINGIKGKISTATFDSNGQTLNAKIVTYTKSDQVWLIYYQAIPANEANLSKIFEHLLQTFKAS